ncbi:hypothetical protein Q7P35_008391 [Cladosporium inversicolor]
MFHEGDLQSGISTAIQEQKLVACFIRQDDDERSATWENEWLAGTHETASDTEPTANIPTILKSKTVLLRLDYGTQEASFLGAFCPIDAAPTLVIIHNGTVVDKLEGSLEYSEWEQRLLKACGVDAECGNVEAPAQPQQQAAITLPPATVAVDDATSEGAASAPADPTSSHSPEQIQALLSERGARLEAERLRREAREKAERIARARERREEEERAQAAAAQTDKGKGKERADGGESARNKARIDWLQQQAKRKTEAKEEKQRIMARIEADKRERKNRDEERKQAASAMAGEPLPSSSKVPTTSTRTPPTSGTCAIQVRLFDGSSIKGRFTHDSTLATAVREWIKETSPAGGADIPYNFRQILTPHPSRTIEISEEGQTLSDVGLMPTATLVLVPVAGFTEAYSGAGSGGLLGSAYGLVSGAFGLAGSALGYVTGYGSGVNNTDGGREGIYMGGTADEQEPSNVQGSRMANADSGTGQSGPSRIRVKTMAEQRAENEKGAEFYNGNSLGTEGRKDDADDKKQ